MDIVWTDHALERVKERFSDRPDVLIPCDRILQFARHAQNDSPFKVHSQGIIYVCRRVSTVRVCVVTVMERS